MHLHTLMALPPVSLLRPLSFQSTFLPAEQHFVGRCSSQNLGEHDRGTAVWTLSKGGIGRLEPRLFVGPDQVTKRQDGCSSPLAGPFTATIISFLNWMKVFTKLLMASAILALSHLRSSVRHRMK